MCSRLIILAFSCFNLDSTGLQTIALKYTQQPHQSFIIFWQSFCFVSYTKERHKAANPNTPVRIAVKAVDDDAETDPLARVGASVPFVLSVGAMVPFLVVAAIVGADVVSVDTGAVVVSVGTGAVVVSVDTGAVVVSVGTGAVVVLVGTGAVVLSVDTGAVVVVVSGGVGETVTGMPVAEGGVELGGKVGPIIGIMEVRIEGKSAVVGASGEKDPQSVVHS